MSRRPVDFDIVEIRRLLRTDLSVYRIALNLGCTPNSLYRFIRRNRLVDVRERIDFIFTQRNCVNATKSAQEQRP